MLIFDMLRLFRDPFCFSIIEGEGTESGGTATETEEKPEGEETSENEEEVVTIGGKEYKASELVGADGISRSKNLSVELERKNKELKEKDELLKGIVKPAPAAVDPQKHFDSVVDAIKSEFPDVSDDQIKMTVKVMQGGANAQAIARAPQDAAANVDREKSRVLRDKSDGNKLHRTTLEKLEVEIDAKIAAMPQGWMADPRTAGQALDNAINVVKGEHVDDILEDARKGLDNRGGIRPRETSSAGGGGSKTPKGTGSHGAGLTDAQEKDRIGIGNIPISDYKVTLKKAQDRDKAAGKQPRQTLNN